MGFRNEMDEEFERQEREKKRREIEEVTIRRYCAEHDMPFSEIEADKILHPEDYDDFGSRRRFT
jgi:hypothetical protein